MDVQRQRVIAHKMVVQILKERGINESIMRDLGNTAKKIGVSTDELKQFIEANLPEVLASILGRKNVTLTTQ